MQINFTDFHHPSRLRRYGWQASQAEQICKGVSHEVLTKWDN